MQEDKEGVFDGIDTVKDCMVLFTGMLSTMRFDKKRMELSSKNGFTNATDLADYLVKKGVPFRDAHEVVGKLVLKCVDKNVSLEDLFLEELKSIHPVFEEDVYEAISLKECVEKRNTIGAPGKKAMEEVMKVYEEYLKEGLL
jgi:argininosuccinate lyase